MNKNFKTVLMLFLIAAVFVLPVALAGEAHAGKLQDAIAKAPQGVEKGQIDPAGKPGYLGIPGGLQINPFVAFIWAVWVGWVFSTVGAFGGVLAGVGHISIFGLGAYAKTFKDTAPELNKFVTDSIRVSNQWLVGLSALVSSANYAKQKRLGLFLWVCSLAQGRCLQPSWWFIQQWARSSFLSTRDISALSF